MPRVGTVSRGLAAWIIVLLMASASVHADERVVTLVSDPWPPYVLGETGGVATGGIGVELLRAIFDRVDGVRLELPLVPWNRALRAVQQGTQDGFGILLRTPEREAYLVYTDAVFVSHNVIWFARSRFPDGFEWTGYDDFKPYTLGVVTGHSYGDELDRLLTAGAMNAVNVSSADKLFVMMAKGRVDLAIVDRFVGRALAADHDGAEDRFGVATRPAAEEIFHIAFSRKSNARELIPAVNRAIADLKSEGVIDRILNRHSAAPGARATTDTGH